MRAHLAIASTSVIAAGTLLGLTGLATSATATQPLPGVSQARCPKQAAQVLPGDAIAGATSAALAQAPAIYRATKLEGMRATSATLAIEGGRGNYARVKCGRAVQRRTVVVGLEFPAMLPSASVSQGVVLVSRFAGVYRVWAELH